MIDAAQQNVGTPNCFPVSDHFSLDVMCRNTS